jgi:phosphoribosylanthranilate isomerase
MIVKICGLTRPEDARHAVRHGATALGFVFWPHSPRYVEPSRAAEMIAGLPETVTPVGLFVNQPVEEIQRIARLTGVSAVQLHGDEPAEYVEALDRPVWRALDVASAPDRLAAWPPGAIILLDAHDPVRRGGTGRVIDWTAAARVAAGRTVVLAGGLTPENVRSAIEAVRPAGVDVSSGVEISPGVKDPDRVALFLERARAAFHGC